MPEKYNVVVDAMIFANAIVGNRKPYNNILLAIENQGLQLFVGERIADECIKLFDNSCLSVSSPKEVLEVSDTHRKKITEVMSGASRVDDLVVDMNVKSIRSALRDRTDMKYVIAALNVAKVFEGCTFLISNDNDITNLGPLLTNLYIETLNAQQFARDYLA